MTLADEPQPKEAAGTKRKLAAILHADVVGYSRLMGDDEDGTHARLVAYRAVFDKLVSVHGGRIVGTAGDAVLADFSSVIEGLSAAVEIQTKLAEQNATLPPEQKFHFRIGINLGDVIIDGDDIFGDGVNVAARVQSLADPGGIAISGAVHDQVVKKVDFGFHYRGEHRVKNVSEPVRVFAVSAAGSAITPVQKPPRRRRLLAVAAATVLVVVGGALLWRWGPIGIPRVGPEAPKAVDSRVQEQRQAGKPTIAVLPFEDRGGSDEAQTYFSDGITEDIISDLGRFSNLLVLSWNAVAPYKGRAISPEELGRDLDVRYVVGGTVRRAGNGLRVTIQLTDAERGVLLWSERYDEQLEDVFALQDSIVRSVVGALAVRLTHLEQERVFEKPTENLGAYDLVLRGRDLLRRVERGTNLEARAMFERAIEIDPRYGDAYVGLGWTHINDILWGWSEWPHRSLERAGELATRAIALDDQNAPAHALLAQVFRFQQDQDRAEQEATRAIELNPNNATSHAILGTLRVWAGQPEEALPPLELAVRLDPSPIAWSVVNLGLTYYLLGRYEDAIALLDRYAGRFAEDPAPFAVQAAAYAQIGRLDEAAQAVARLKRISPFFDARVYAGNFANPEHSRHFLDGMHKAGLN